MNRRVRQAVLRILLLTEEFSPEELNEAVELVGGHEEEDLLTFLNRITARKQTEVRSGETSSTKAGETRALQELKSTDSEKYQVLRAFETAIREGRVLKTLDELRAFGTGLVKEFVPGKSRREGLGRLMAVLVQMDLDSIRATIAKAPSRSGEEGNGFRRLANQIISGPREQSPGE